MNEPETIRLMLGQWSDRGRTIAVIGLSDRQERPSNYVSEYMQQNGYRIIPVNPSLKTVLGEDSYPSLAALPFKPDVVNVFRPAEAIPGIVEEMIRLELTCLWVQQGIVNQEAASLAQRNGIRVVMDRCIMVEHRKAL
jgi:predicted CoA-binding protein